MRHPALRVFVAVLCVAALLHGFLVPALGLSASGYWIAVLVLAALLSGGLLRSPGDRSGAPRGTFLCDSCRLDHPRYCSRPERPNATRCEDYERR